jgi:hypothetical protein
MPKPILCLDFDGVIHSYTSGWQGPDVINDAPVPGAMDFIAEASHSFTIAIFSSRSNQPGGIEAMQDYIKYYLEQELAEYGVSVFKLLQWPIIKPPAFLTIDDRAITFTGEWPEPRSLFDFRVWYKKERP